MIDLGGDVTGNGISKMVFTILAAVAEGERDRIRERIRDAKRHLTSQGVFTGGKRPFGFDLVQDADVTRMVPNATEQAVIERMKAMRASGAIVRSAVRSACLAARCSGSWIALAVDSRPMAGPPSGH